MGCGLRQYQGLCWKKYVGFFDFSVGYAALSVEEVQCNEQALERGGHDWWRQSSQGIAVLDV